MTFLKHADHRTASPHDGALPAQTEAGFQAQVVKYARLRGWRVYHTYASNRSAEGFPDLVLVRARHARPRVVFAELKSERGTVTLAQRTWLAELDEAGAETHVWRPSDWRQIEEILR